MTVGLLRVLTAPQLQHRTQWGRRRRSPARQLPEQPCCSNINSSLPSSFPPFPSARESTSACPVLGFKSLLLCFLVGEFFFFSSPPTPFLSALGGFLFLGFNEKLVIQLTVLSLQSRTLASIESGVSVRRHTEPNLHHTGGDKGITMGPFIRRKMKQHKTAQGGGGRGYAGREGRRGKRGGRKSIRVLKWRKEIGEGGGCCCLPLRLYACVFVGPTRHPWLFFRCQNCIRHDACYLCVAAGLVAFSH